MTLRLRCIDAQQIDPAAVDAALAEDARSFMHCGLDFIVAPGFMKHHHTQFKPVAGFGGAWQVVQYGQWLHGQRLRTSRVREQCEHDEKNRQDCAEQRPA